MRFAKMHGCGNDFVIVDGPVDLDPERVRALCDRRSGIGADGVIVIGAAEGRTWPVAAHNADGSVAEACGNGYRCVTRHLLDLHGGEDLVLRTPAGSIAGRRDPAGIAIELPAPVIGETLSVSLDGATLEARRVRVGNPNVVVLVDDPASCDLESLARAVTARTGPANVEAVAVRAPDLLEMRTHERGVGETLACGTGSCAAVAATRIPRAVDEAVRVRVRGGTLVVTPRADGYTLAGPAEYVYRGETA